MVVLSSVSISRLTKTRRVTLTDRASRFHVGLRPHFVLQLVDVLAILVAFWVQAFRVAAYPAGTHSQSVTVSFVKAISYPDGAMVDYGSIVSFAIATEVGRASQNATCTAWNKDVTRRAPLFHSFEEGWCCRTLFLQHRPSGRRVK
ncbi:hypothetical protein TRVL_07309 [Trypanosoma vivax]|nr:hypothetical protein TRVL_07309 [Trypanosoma vivax]